MKRNLWMLVTLIGMLAWLPAVSAQKEALPLKAEVVNVEPFSYVALENTGPYTEYAARQQTFYAEIARQDVKPIDVQFTLYWNSPLFVKPHELKWDIAFPVTSATKVAPPLVLKRFNHRQCAVAIHVGPYLTTVQTINALYSWLAAKGRKAATGPCMERYLDPDPAVVADSAKRTQILIPLQ